MSNSLDNLAANNIIDFDADSWVKNKSPRYVGDPDGELYMPFDKPLPAFCDEPTYGVKGGEKLHGQPSRDAFVTHSEGKRKRNWKAILFGVLAGAGTIFVGVKYRTKIGDFFKRIFRRTPANATPPTPPPPATPPRRRFRIPKGVKIAGGALAGLFAIYEGLRFFARKKYNKQQESMGLSGITGPLNAAPETPPEVHIAATSKPEATLEATPEPAKEG